MPVLPSTLVDAPAELLHVIGQDSTKRYNVHVLDDHTVAMAVGNTVQIIDVYSGEVKRALHGHDCGGIGALAVHPSKEYFAVGEKGDNPNIYVYRWPSLDVAKVLRGGTMRGYADMCFSPGQGELLATVGSSPDYMLTVWNWSTEGVLLRSKAFGQDVFRVSFHPETEGLLTTSGVGHVKFWTMAHTFTGLKLKGFIGKFGKVEISDIPGYAELPDGKVLSGSETGDLFMWDDNHIKYVVPNAHTGMIETVMLVKDKWFMTAGHDGYVRYWDFAALDVAEPQEDQPLLVDPVKSVFIGENVQIRCFVKSEKWWIIVDQNGQLLRVDHPEADPDQSKQSEGEGTQSTATVDGPLRKITVLRRFHAGAVTASDISPSEYIAVTGGADGRVRVHDLLSKEIVCERTFSAGVSFLKFQHQDARRLWVGFEDGTVRRLSLHDGGQLELEWVSKPHTMPVTGIVRSKRFLVTSSMDGTIFYFTVTHPTPDQEQYKALCFTSPSASISSLPVVSIQWKEQEFAEAEGEESALLCCMEDGEVLEVYSPNPDDVDNLTTFEYLGPALGKRKYLYTTKITPPVEEKSPEELKEEEEKKKAQDQDNFLNDDFLDTDSPVVREVPESERRGKLLRGQRWESSLGTNQDEEPIRQWSMHPNSTCTVAAWSSKHQCMLTGGRDGAVILQSSSGAASGFRAHDTDLGGVSGAFLTHDGAMLCSTGFDGTLYVWKLNGKDLLPVSRSSFLPPVQVEHVQDIKDHHSYSIQEEKLKAEADSMLSLAERKKNAVREKIVELRQFFKDVVQRNIELLPPQYRLTHEELEVDPELNDKLRHRMKQKEDQVRAELAYESERRRLQLSKLKSKTLDTVAVERIVLSSFDHLRQVASFRAPFLPAHLQQAIQEVHQLIEREDAVRRNRMGTQPGTSPADGAHFLGSPVAAHHPTQLSGLSPSATSMDGTNTIGAVSPSMSVNMSAINNQSQANITAAGAEAKEDEASKLLRRRMERAARKKRFDNLMGRKPDDRYEDPRDVAAIAWAEKHMGDFKLKMDPSYVVPDHLRVNAEKKRRQMVLLEESIFTLKMDFNERVFALRDLKQRLCEQVSREMERVRALHQLLGTKYHAKAPTMGSAERPEDRSVTDRKSLDEFDRKQREERDRQDKAKRSAAAGGFGGFGGGGSSGQEEHASTTDKGHTSDHKTKKDIHDDHRHPQDEDAKKKKAAASGSGKEGGKKKKDHHSSHHGGSGHHGHDHHEKLERDFAERASHIVRSQEEEEELLLEHLKLEQECLRLERKINRTMEAFDEAVEELQEEKLKLEGDLKTTDLKLLLLYDELQLLKEFEKKDQALAKKLDVKRGEKNDILTKIMSCQERLKGKKVEIEHLLEKEKVLISDFHSQVASPGSEFYDALLKVFKRKVKRSKKKNVPVVPAVVEETATPGNPLLRKSLLGNAAAVANQKKQEEDEVSEDSDDFEDDIEYNSDEDAEEDEEDRCPDGCSQSAFQKVLELREVRMDQEEDLAEFQKSIEALKKENDQLMNKERVSDTALKAVEKEIQEFQNEKQRKLNELSVVVPLRLHQIMNLTHDGRIPDDLKTSVVFTATSLEDLSARIGEIQKEKSDLRRHIRELRRQIQVLGRSQKEKEDIVFQLEAKLYEVQLLKFGREVDIDALESASMDRRSEELKAELMRLEETIQSRTRRLDKEIFDIKAEVAALTDIQTEKLRRLADLREEMQRLERDLNKSQKSSVQQAEGEKNEWKDERKQLKDIVIQQAREIEAMKQEIIILRRKGGHVYAPVGV